MGDPASAAALAVRRTLFRRPRAAIERGPRRFGARTKGDAAAPNALPGPMRGGPAGAPEPTPAGATEGCTPRRLAGGFRGAAEFVDRTGLGAAECGAAVDDAAHRGGGASAAVARRLQQVIADASARVRVPPSPPPSAPSPSPSPPQAPRRPPSPRPSRPPRTSPSSRLLKPPLRPPLLLPQPLPSPLPPLWPLTPLPLTSSPPPRPLRRPPPPLPPRPPSPPPSPLPLPPSSPPPSPPTLPPPSLPPLSPPPSPPPPLKRLSPRRPRPPSPQPSPPPRPPSPPASPPTSPSPSRPPPKRLPPPPPPRRPPSPAASPLPTPPPKTPSPPPPLPPSIFAELLRSPSPPTRKISPAPKPPPGIVPRPKSPPPPSPPPPAQAAVLPPHEPPPPPPPLDAPPALSRSSAVAAGNISVVVMLVQVCDAKPTVSVNDVRKLILDSASGGAPTLQSVMASLSLGQLTVPTSGLFIAPEVVSIPCSGSGPRGPWVASQCDERSIEGWPVAASEQVRQRWGIHTTMGAPYDRIVLVLPEGSSCINSYGPITCPSSFWGSDISTCYVLLRYMEMYSLAHELGHTLGLAHSKRDGLTSEYGDETCIMGSGRGTTCLNAPNMASLGWATPAANLSGRDLPPGSWTPFTLPALAANRRNHLRVSPDWLLPAPLGDAASGALYVSYRAPVGCDAGLGPAYAGGVALHALVNTSPRWPNNTYYMGSSFPGRMWPDPAASPRIVAAPSLRLAMRVAARGPLTDAVPWVRVELCRYSVAHEAGWCGNGLDDDCDGLVDRADPDCR